MLFDRAKNRPRRVDPQRNRGNGPGDWWRELQASGSLASLGIAAGFFIGLTALLLLREDVIPYRQGQYLTHDVTSRVDFTFKDFDKLAGMRVRAGEQAPHVYRAASADYFGALQDQLTSLPDRTYHHRLGELSEDLSRVLDPGDLSTLERYHDREREKYADSVARYVKRVHDQIVTHDRAVVILPAEQRQAELGRIDRDGPGADKINLWPAGAAASSQDQVNVATETYSTELPPEVLTQLQNLGDTLPISLKTAIAKLTFNYLSQHPTHVKDEAASDTARSIAEKSVPETEAQRSYARDSVIVWKGIVDDRARQLLWAENQAFLQELDPYRLSQRIGTMLTALIITCVLAAYVGRYQPRIVRNHARGFALGALILSMLLLSTLAGIGSSSLYAFAIAPIILSAIILTIAYDQRFAIGVASIESFTVTLALNQGVGFFLILLVGLLVACLLLDDIRTRSKLIEVGGLAACAMMIVTLAEGLGSLDPRPFIAQNCLHVGAAGLAAGFITLGILPFIERTFKITTSMTLLELADASQPLLRRLALEAPGTYNHSLQVATLAEEAAEAIGANPLACRVGAYYHDIGKISKADYFAENMVGGSPSRHLNLSPSVSLLIIIGHVKDGMELAREYNLPTSLLSYIQQHHGTTLVEYFYNEACKNNKSPGAHDVPETQYRYPGPKPKSRETAILMLSDCVESACRAMREPNASRIEALVHDLAMRRLQDGQFDECDLTLRDLQAIERSLIKTLLGIYHGRIAYPSTDKFSAPPKPVFGDVRPSGDADIRSA